MPMITREKAIELAGKTHWMLPEAISRRDKTIPCAERLGETEPTDHFGPKYFETIDSARKHVEDVLYRRNGSVSLIGHQWRSKIRPVLQTMRHRVLGIKPTPLYPFEEHKLPSQMRAPIYLDVGHKVYLMDQRNGDEKISIRESKISAVNVRCAFGEMAYGHGKNTYMAWPGIEFSKASANSLRLVFGYSAQIYEAHSYDSGVRTFGFNKYDGPGQEKENDPALNSATDYASADRGIKVFFTVAAIENYLEQEKIKLTKEIGRIFNTELSAIPQLKEGLHNTPS